MKSQAYLVSFILTLILTATATVLTVSVILPSMEKHKSSSIITDAIGKMSNLDFLITRLASEGVGSEFTYDLEVKGGEFIVDNKTNMIIFEYESPYLPFEKVFKKRGDLIITAGTFPNVSCSLRYGSCEENETCLFSLYSEINSHLGNCSAYDYKVCCENLKAETGTCTPTSTALFSLAKEENSHANYEKTREYNITICVSPQPVCVLRPQCQKNEVCIVSFYSDINSHAAKCDYYKNNLCCQWVTRPIVKMFLKYNDIKLVGSYVFPKGKYKLCLEKIGESNGVSTVEVKTC